MSEQEKKEDRVQIETSAMTNRDDRLKTPQKVANPVEAHGEVRSSRQQAPAPWSKDEPLTKVHSLLGHFAQGDVYRNDLDLVYDRITGEAEAPDFVAPSEGIEEAISEPLPPSREDFDIESFGMISGESSIQVSEKDVMTEESRSSTSIFEGDEIEDFDRIYETAHTSPHLSKVEVEAMLKSQDDMIDDDHLALLSGADEGEWLKEQESDSGHSLRSRVIIEEDTSPEQQERILGEDTLINEE